MGGLNNPSPQVVPYMPIIPGLFAKYFNRTTGMYYGPLGVIQAAGSTATAADNLHTIPFMVLVAETFDRISVYIETAAEGKARLGIYADSGTQVPGVLTLDAGEIDTSTTGAKEISINQTLQPGLYWLAMIFNATPKTTVSASVVNLLGMGVQSLSAYNTGQNCMYRTSRAYGELPNPHPVATAYPTSAMPIICLRRA